MKIIAALAASLALAACQSASEPPAPTTGGDAGDGVTLRIKTPERIAGSYVDAHGGIDFDSARSGDNLYLHVATKSGHVLIDAQTTPTSYVFHYYDGRLTLEVDQAWVNLVQQQGADGPAAADDSQMHWTGDTSVLDEMLALPEVAGLPNLSRALGEMGVTGNEFPASLALHKIARQSADALSIDVAPLAPAAESSFCQAYPNQGNDCYGMCGPGCSCWSWVCGDCCYHSGCAVHDSWCREGKWWYCYNITAVVALFGC